MNHKSYNIILLTESVDIYNCLNCYFQESDFLKTKYQVSWLAGYSQWEKYCRHQQYQIFLVDYQFFLVLKQKNYLSHTPLIVLTENYDTGLNVIQLGATDYWNLQNLDNYIIERSLRLILNNQNQVSRAKFQPNTAFYEDFFSHCVDGLFSIDILPDGTLVYGTVNSAYEKLIGIDQAEITGKKITEVLPTLEERKYRDCIFSQTTVSYEHTVQIEAETHTWLIVLVPVKNQQGKTYKLQGSARNITKEKQAITQQIRQTRYRNLLRSIALKIRQSLNIQNIIAVTVTEIQKILQIERVIILQFLSNGSAQVIEESVAANFPLMLGEIIEDEYYEQILSYKYDEGNFYAWEDIEKVELPSSYRKLLQKYQVRANLVIPIVRSNRINHRNQLTTNKTTRLWGLLCVQQCSQPRQWTREEIELLQQLVEQLNVALSQAELLQSEVKQRQELARSNSELEQFAYIVSHDLQAPLQTISNYAQLIDHRYREQLDEKADKYINYILDAVERMRTQIDDLLEYSRVNRQQNTFRETDCRFIVEQAIANLESEIEINQAEITYSNHFPTLIVDHSQFMILFQNLIGNSLKYRRSIPLTIKIGVTKQENAWQFFVQDNGIGIESKHQKRIFQIFQRLHTQGEYPGTGIGLAICQKIVQRHGGDIWLESQLNQGTTFYFTIPSQRNLNH